MYNKLVLIIKLRNWINKFAKLIKEPRNWFNNWNKLQMPVDGAKMLQINNKTYLLHRNQN